MDYDELLALCDKATPGLWKVVPLLDADGKPFATMFEAWQFVGASSGCAFWKDSQSTANAEYVAALDPTTVLGPSVVRQLITRIRQLEIEVQRYRAIAVQAERDFRREARDIAAEARWKAMQDYDYGSY